ncbi:hypothetical protein [Saliterribacillus persicus]|uniref:Uncharacterized protein n=1 Tax=Saliterribacillus persicus TaxID=930114 RepID=A0A368XE08_9BACI|nr:hypothetical protein [Saliterribacillus persicus]RCW65889.1 hypothetical protein DFR57_110107 [Saliterribacillus persicus]
MKKKRTISLICALILLLASGYFLKDYIKDSNESEKYTGESLVIGTIGAKQKVDNPRVKYVELSIEDLDAIHTSEYDAIILSGESVFKEASKNIYTDTFNKLRIPVFFLELFKPYTIFTSKNYTYDDAGTYDFLGATQGILNKEDGSILKWSINVHEASKNSIDQIRYTEIFNIVDQL